MNKAVILDAAGDSVTDRPGAAGPAGGTATDRETGGIRHLGDFTTRPRVLLISAIAVVVGTAGVFSGVVLLGLIRLFTNLSYFGSFSTVVRPFAQSPLGLLRVFIPVLGALIVGLMARYGTDKIRGHGIPEAIEAILLGRSRLDLKVTILKPLSSAIAIGTGGPFGAEGPIIMTGGAVGSLIAQMLPVSDTERKTLLVAGAAAGMTTVFGTPIAAILLAVELLLFEWSPRSFIPVATAAIIAEVERTWLGLPSPLFPFHGGMAISFLGLGSWIFVGLLAGLLSGVLTQLVYACEDGFLKLPIHWMWWPLLGGLVVGIGGLADPRALGVGYDNIAHMLAGNVLPASAILLLVVKADYLGGGARLGHLGRRAGAVAHHRRRARRGTRGTPAPRLPGILGAHRHVRDHGRNDARAAHGDLLCRRGHRQHPRASPTHRRLRHRACRDGSPDAPLDPHREGRAPRPSPDARVSR